MCIITKQSLQTGQKQGSESTYVEKHATCQHKHPDSDGGKGRNEGGRGVWKKQPGFGFHEDFIPETNKYIMSLECDPLCFYSNLVILNISTQIY